MKVIDAVCVTSQYIQRQQIEFNELTGLISKVGNLNKVPDYFFGDDCFLFAGMGDVHIHAREDVSGKNCYKEDFNSAFNSMKNGGVVQAGDMPNNPVPPVDDESYRSKYNLMRKTQGALWMYAGIGPATRPLSYKVPYKVYMGPSVGELYFKNYQELDQTLEHYQGQHVSFHCEDPEILELHKMAKHHHEKRPIEAEVLATKDALKLIEKYHLKGKLCHYSTGEGLKLIREARKRGVDVSVEATPQHLYFDIEQLMEKDLNFFQMNPPIRTAYDRRELLKALICGEIDFLATDHAPHTLDEKRSGISGLTGLDTYGPFVSWLMDEGVEPQRIALIASEKPGIFHNTFLSTWEMLNEGKVLFGKGYGFLEENYLACFTVINLKNKIQITEANLKTKVGHSPFDGITFPGRVEALFIRGRKI
jgi:dihydroorotase